MCLPDPLPYGVQYLHSRAPTEHAQTAVPLLPGQGRHHLLPKPGRVGPEAPDSRRPACVSPLSQLTAVSHRLLLRADVGRVPSERRGDAAACFRAGAHCALHGGRGRGREGHSLSKNHRLTMENRSGEVCNTALQGR